MTDVLVLVGSLRSGSVNRQLAEAAAESAPDDVRLTVYPDLGDLPFYNEDLDVDPAPAPVAALRAAAADADAALVVTPEYNGTIPAVLKNAIDWLSRPAGELRQLFGGRPLALMGASPSGFGTLLAQAAWLPVLKSLGVQVWTGKSLMLSRAHQSIGADGEIVDEAALKTIADFVSGYAASLEGR